MYFTVRKKQTNRTKDKIQKSVNFGTKDQDRDRLFSPFSFTGSQRIVVRKGSIVGEKKKKGG